MAGRLGPCSCGCLRPCSGRKSLHDPSLNILWNGTIKNQEGKRKATQHSRKGCQIRGMPDNSQFSINFLENLVCLATVFLRAFQTHKAGCQLQKKTSHCDLVEPKGARHRAEIWRRGSISWNSSSRPEAGFLPQGGFNHLQKGVHNPPGSTGKRKIVPQKEGWEGRLPKPSYRQLL